MVALASSVQLCPAFPVAWLVLADGSVFQGFSIGADGETVGEVVFNTAMTGYQEILTDPSYARQLVTLTYPHIGNVGVNAQDAEAPMPYASGLIIRDLPVLSSNFRQEETLSGYLKRHRVVAIAGIDTRALTQKLRTSGAQAGAIVTAPAATANQDRETRLSQAREQLSRFPGLAGMDLAREVSTPKPYLWEETTWNITSGFGRLASYRHHVVAYDFGVKRNILRLLAAHGCRVTVVPAQTPVDEVAALKPDGIFLSNGPGDPEPCDYAIASAKTWLARRVPMFGICLGHQILGLAVGAKTFKMKFGHHGANHPVLDLASKRVWITSQNHGFAVDADTLPPHTRVTHVSLFDGSLQGFECTDAPAFCFQGHPEASPGPHDIIPLFERFVSLMDARA